MTKETFKLIHSDLICEVQMIENDLRLVYGALKPGNFDKNFDYLEKANLGKIIYEVKRTDEIDGYPDLSDDDYKWLDNIREIRNYWCHQCYNDFVYISNRCLREEKFQEIALRLHDDENRTRALQKHVKKLRVKILKEYSKAVK